VEITPEDIADIRFPALSRIMVALLYAYSETWIKVILIARSFTYRATFTSLKLVTPKMDVEMVTIFGLDLTQNSCSDSANPAQLIDALSWLNP